MPNPKLIKGHGRSPLQPLGVAPAHRERDPAPVNLPDRTFAEVLVHMLERLGVCCAFGIPGGAIVPLWTALRRSAIPVLHFRHEAGAAFAAAEASLASGRPAVVFTTTGPGLSNALTGLFTARSEGARVILLSASTSPALRGRWALQETSGYTMPVSGLFTSGPLFCYATAIENACELEEAARRLAGGLTAPQGFVAHLSVPTTLQAAPTRVALSHAGASHCSVGASAEAVARCAGLLGEGPFAIWAGFGARGAAAEILALAEQAGAPVICTPRAKGIFPEDHPLYVGVSGFGGHPSVLSFMKEHRPRRLLVLGTRLGEFTSFWSPAMVPARGFIHVDVDREVPGTAYPSAETVSVQAEIRAFVSALRGALPSLPDAQPEALPRPWPGPEAVLEDQAPQPGRPVRPEALMAAVQRVIVDGSDAIVMGEPGNSFAWTTHLLRFRQPGRYRISTGHSSMGHTVTGVVGAAYGRRGKAVAIVGDGAMLMLSEISTAVRYGIPAVWIVLNDGCYNMVAQGMSLLGFHEPMDVDIPTVDFALLARALGAPSRSVEQETDLEPALAQAMASPGPFLIDVLIDRTRPAPIGSRILSLAEQNATAPAGTRRQTPPDPARPR